jgi:hypothetical protein
MLIKCSILAGIFITLLFCFPVIVQADESPGLLQTPEGKVLKFVSDSYGITLDFLQIGYKKTIIENINHTR